MLSLDWSMVNLPLTLEKTGKGGRINWYTGRKSRQKLMLVSEQFNVLNLVGPVVIFPE